MERVTYLSWCMMGLMNQFSDGFVEVSCLIHSTQACVFCFVATEDSLLTAMAILESLTLEMEGSEHRSIRK